MTHFDLSMGSMPFVTSGLVQGLGIGLIFVPLSVTAFGTLNPAFRAEGAAVYTLVRNLGSAVGISLMEAFDTRETAVAHADLAQNIQPGNAVVAAGLPPSMNPATTAGLEALNSEITRQAAFVALVDVFRLMLIMTICVIPLLFIMRRPGAAPPSQEVAVD
jgi:DHA2 family multidrug resistance protein